MADARREGNSHETTGQQGIPSRSFPYDKLDGAKPFRLITVLAGENDEPLECVLTHADLSTYPVPEYETISYCWGDANTRDTITMNDMQLSVPASTAAALRRVRLSDSSRLIWLDAVCIDQTSLDERSQQVAMMDAIYRNGRRNLIYLGEHDITEAMNSVRAILSEALHTEGSFTLLRNEVGAWQYSTTPIHAEYSTEALIKFFEIPWFR
jgi:hypothetical protein